MIAQSKTCLSKAEGSKTCTEPFDSAQDKLHRSIEDPKWKCWRTRWSNEQMREAAVIGKQHEIKEKAICAFVSLSRDSEFAFSGGRTEGPCGEEDRPHRPTDEILFAAELLKTRSGKIMRRLLRDIADGRALGDTPTLADPAVVAKLKEQYQEE
jgi:acyl-CoA synthetase (AMP-forming)/AMP-acid ligase II